MIRFNDLLDRLSGALIGLMAAMVLSVTASTSAQFGDAAGIGEAMKPEFFNRDITLIVEGLELDETQRFIVEALYEDYQADFEAGVDRMKERFLAMKEELATQDHQRVVRMVFSPWEAWSAERRQLGEGFLENIKVILSPAQLAAWPTFERRLYREKNVHKGRLTGESTDLFHVVRDMDLEPPVMAMIEPVLNEYDLALDAALRRRERVSKDGQTAMIRSLQEGDAQTGVDIIERKITVRIEVRSVNDTYIELIAGAMPNGLAAEFRSQALERAYPRIYRALPIERLFEAAMKLPELDPATIAELELLLAAFRAELEPMNASLLQELKKHEPAAQRRRAKVSAARMAGEAGSRIPPIKAPNFQRRNILSRQYAGMLQDLLTLEQFESLPGASRWLTAKAKKSEVGAESGLKQGIKGQAPRAARQATKDDQVGNKQRLNRADRPARNK